MTTETLTDHQRTAAAIAEHLTSPDGARWHLVPNDVNPRQHAEITDDTTTLTAQAQWNSDRLEIRPSYVHHDHRGYSAPPAPTITVGATRAPEAIAKDISRRLLADAIAWQQARRDLVAELDAAREARHDGAERIAAILGETYDRTKTDHGRAISAGEVRWYSGPASTLGDFKANHDGTTWSIDLHSIPAEQAEAIARILAGMTSS